ncbi:MAG: aldose-1-epimerase [Nocardioidaceae bacterium]
MDAPSGRSIHLRAGGYEAVVVEVGAGLRTLTRSGYDVVDGYPPSAMCSGGRGQVLIPWPNRIGDGRYTFRGEAHRLSLSEPVNSNAIHGLTRWVNWSLLDHAADSALWGYRLPPQPGYPFALDLSIAYTLTTTGLRVEVTASNVGDDPAPYGHGAHPYLSVGRRIDDCELTLPASTRLVVDGRGLPSGTEPVEQANVDFRHPGSIGGTTLDDPFTDLAREPDGTARVLLRDPATERTATLWADASYAWLQVFSGDTLSSRRREALAVEPMTCPPDAFNSGTDLVVLEPGDTHTGTFGLA